MRSAADASRRGYVSTTWLREPAELAEFVVAARGRRLRQVPAPETLGHAGERGGAAGDVAREQRDDRKPREQQERPEEQAERSEPHACEPRRQRLGGDGDHRPLIGVVWCARHAHVGGAAAMRLHHAMVADGGCRELRPRARPSAESLARPLRIGGVEDHLPAMRVDDLKSRRVGGRGGLAAEGFDRDLEVDERGRAPVHLRQRRRVRDDPVLVSGETYGRAWKAAPRGSANVAGKNVGTGFVRGEVLAPVRASPHDACDSRLRPGR